MAQRQLGREVVAQSFGGLPCTLLSKGHAQAGRELGKKAVLIHHGAVHHRIHERLAVVRGHFKSVAQPGGFLASGAGGGAYEDVDQSRGGHVGRYNAATRVKFRVLCKRIIHKEKRWSEGNHVLHAQPL